MCGGQPDSCLGSQCSILPECNEIEALGSEPPLATEPAQPVTTPRPSIEQTAATAIDVTAGSVTPTTVGATRSDTTATLPETAPAVGGGAVTNVTSRVATTPAPEPGGGCGVESELFGCADDSALDEEYDVFIPDLPGAIEAGGGSSGGGGGGGGPDDGGGLRVSEFTHKSHGFLSWGRSWSEDATGMRTGVTGLITPLVLSGTEWDLRSCPRCILYLRFGMRAARSWVRARGRHDPAFVSALARWSNRGTASRLPASYCLQYPTGLTHMACDVQLFDSYVLQGLPVLTPMVCKV